MDHQTSLPEFFPFSLNHFCSVPESLRARALSEADRGKDKCSLAPASHGLKLPEPQEPEGPDCFRGKGSILSEISHSSLLAFLAN